MRAAPAVSADLPACRAERMLIIALYALTGAALGYWGAALPGWPSDPWVWALTLMLPAGWLGAWVARRLLPGKLTGLRWSGEAWAVITTDTQAGDAFRILPKLAVALDLGPWLLLKAAETNGARLWLVLRQRQAGPAWHLLRVALQAHATRPGPGAPP